MITNNLRDRWYAAVCRDSALSSDTKRIAAVLAAATATGNIAMTNYRRCNQALGLPVNDLAVFSWVGKLREGGYLGSYWSTGPGWSNGWQLTLPSRE